VENTAAQILRSPDEKQIAISLPQKTKRTVKLRLHKSINAPGGDRPRVQENSRTIHFIFTVIIKLRVNIILTKNYYLVLRFDSIEGSNIHQQLVAAQKAVFEEGLFDQVCFISMEQINLFKKVKSMN